MSYVNGVNLLPATGEWTYDVAPYRGQRLEEPDPLPPRPAAPGFHLPFSGNAKFIRPWRVRMKE